MKNLIHIACHADVDSIIATGAELKGAFCLGKDNEAILSPGFGDLTSIESFETYEQALTDFCQRFQIKPTLIAHDMHPDYLSTKWANGQGSATLPIQHHHAHIASCMAEHELNEPVIGFSFDGTGVGDDGHIWGGEVLLCDYSHYKRLAHLDYIPLPGGDIAVKEPWRMAVSYLYATFGTSFLELKLPFLKTIEEKKVRLLIDILNKKINTPLTSSMGRVFDAVAAILGVCSTAEFDAQAPILLESMIDKQVKEDYDYLYHAGKFSLFEMIKQIVSDVEKGVDHSTISTKFHNTIVKMILDMSRVLREENGIDKVVLSGGVFMNKYLTACLENLFEIEGIPLYLHKKISTSDEGIALGQLMVAAQKRLSLI